MSALNKIATALGRRDENPNKELALELAKTGNKIWVKELADNLFNKDKNIQSDCIKVLYELGEHKPSLISPYTDSFIQLLHNKNNRLVWGAMHALHCISGENNDSIYKALPKILQVADAGSVITKDHAVGILANLAKNKKYTDYCIELLIDILKDCATNQLPKYAEDTLGVMTKPYLAAFQKTISSRIPGLTPETKKVRLEKVLKKSTKL